MSTTSTCPTCGMQGWPSQIHRTQVAGSCGSRWDTTGTMIATTPGCSRIAELLAELEALKAVAA